MARARRWVVPAAIVALAALVASATTYLLVADEAPAAAVLLEPSVTDGPDAFMSSVTVREIESLPDVVLAVADETRDQARDRARDEAEEADRGAGEETAPAVAVSLSGTTPGLYGGSRDDTLCDVDTMIGFLEANPAHAAAWAGVQGLAVDDLADHLLALTPVALTIDTAVTNHGYADGRATPRQSVLQAGTAILVDDAGAPRARCSCGNPLLPPEPSADPAATTGDPWDGYDPTGVTVVDPGEASDRLVLTDLESGEPYTQFVGLGRGDVQVTLEWEGDADLDLHVVDPAGDEIYYAARTSDSGGELDTDRIPTCGSGSDPQVENVFWPRGDAPPGGYRAWVRQYRPCGAGTQDYRLTVRVRGAVVVDDEGSLRGRDDSPEVEFRV